MDPAEYTHLQAVVAHQGAIICAYLEHLATLQAAQMTSPATTTPTRSELVCMALPEKFDGSQTAAACSCSNATTFLRTSLTSTVSLLSLLTGNHDPHVKSSFTYFSGLIREVFEYSVELLDLCQGSESVVEYAMKFRTLAAQSSWNDAALLAVFCEGLCPALQAEIVCQDTHTSLSEYIITAIGLYSFMCQQLMSMY